MFNHNNWPSKKMLKHNLKAVYLYLITCNNWPIDMNLKHNLKALYL